MPPVCSPVDRLSGLLLVLSGEQLIGTEFPEVMEVSLLTSVIHLSSEPKLLQSLFANGQEMALELHAAYLEL